MIETFVLLGICAAAGLFYFLDRKVLAGKVIKIKKFSMPADEFFRKALSVILFGLFMPHLFGKELISRQYGLDGNGDPDSPLLPGSIYPLFDSPSLTVWIVILKWLTMMMIGVNILLPFFKKKEADDFASFFSPIILILNIVFLKQQAVSIIGRVDFTHWQTVIYCCLLVLIGGISCSKLVDTIVSKDFSSILPRLGKLGLYILF